MRQDADYRLLCAVMPRGVHPGRVRIGAATTVPSMSASRESPDSELVFRLPRRTLRIAGIAFGAGLLLFVIVWLAGRGDDGFYQPEATVEGNKPVVEALPEPLPARGGASGLEEPRQDGNGRPQLVEQAPMPAPIEEAPAPAAPVVPDAPAAPVAGVALAPGDQPVPMAGQTPPPDYPAAALRRGDAGTVMVRVEVGADGVPTDVSVEARSGSRDLDRAALDAVRRWRFNPAQRDGQPVASSVVVPIDFNLQQ
jgi:protein TonB